MASVGIGQVVDNVNIPRPTCIDINISLSILLLSISPIFLPSFLFSFLLHYAIIPIKPLHAATAATSEPVEGREKREGEKDQQQVKQEGYDKNMYHGDPPLSLY